MNRHLRDAGEAGPGSLKEPEAPDVVRSAVNRGALFAGGKKSLGAGSTSRKGYVYVIADYSGRKKVVVRKKSQSKPGTMRAVEVRLRQDDQRLRSTARALAEVLERTDQGLEASPEVARSAQASENRWRAIDTEYGLLDSRKVAELLGGSATNRNKAHQLAKEGRILGVKRGRGVLYPGFQFDHGEVRPVIAQIATIGRLANWTDAHLLLWLASPNGYLEGRIPARMLTDPNKVLEAAHQDMAERW